MSWQDDARRIPLWPTARICGPDGPFYLMALQGEHALVVQASGMHMAGGMVDPNTAYPDLTDPDTQRGAIARLALAMGAPAEAVEEGVLFVRLGERWELSAGVDHDHPEDVGWMETFRAQPNDGRPTAIARAWAEHLDRQE